MGISSHSLFSWCHVAAEKEKDRRQLFNRALLVPHAARQLMPPAASAVVKGAAVIAAAYALSHLVGRWRQRRVVLITGASGYLGQHLLAALSAADPWYELHGTYSGNRAFLDDWGAVCTCHKLALDDASAIAAVLAAVKPDVIVHLAAISSPAKAEQNPAFAQSVNCPSALLSGLAPHASLVFLSTDQVYDGEHAPYTETNEALPVNVYGQSKLDFEREIFRRAPNRSVALRMSLLLGPQAPKRSQKKNSFLQDCDRMLASGKPHDFFDDEYRSVVALDDVLAVLRWAIDGGALSSPGVYNMGGPERPSRVDIARAVARHRGHSEAGIRGMPRPPPVRGGVKSPPNIAMDSSKLERAAGVRFRPLSEMLRSLD